MVEGLLIFVFIRIKVDPFLLDDQRSVHYAGVDAHHVLSYESDEEKLYRINEEQADD